MRRRWGGDVFAWNSHESCSVCIGRVSLCYSIASTSGLGHVTLAHLQLRQRETACPDRPHLEVCPLMPDRPWKIYWEFIGGNAYWQNLSSP